MELAGIFTGLAAAACHSASYVFSRLFLTDGSQSVRRLLISSHLIMGAVSMIVLPFVWNPEVPPPSQFALPLAGAAGFYIVGQTGLFLLMRRTDASLVAPLLSLKIVVLAVLTVTILRRPIGGAQWAAVALAVAAAFLLGAWHGKFPRTGVLWLAVACTGYALSDLSITALVRVIANPPGMHASVLAVCMAYACSGLVALAAIPFSGVERLFAGWRMSLAFSAAWLLAMLFLFSCFGLVGALYGSILQSTRGVMSVALGAYLAHLGLTRLEGKKSRGHLLRQMAAALLMTLAIWLFGAGA